MRRWWRAQVTPILPPPQVKRAIDAAPVIMVAVDTTHPEDERHPAIQRVTRQLLSVSRDFRLVCVSVIPSPPIGGKSAADHHIEHLVRLRNWTEPLPVRSDLMSQHVIEAADPASALLEFAKRNHVDLIVLGAPAPHDEALAWWRSAASSVTANAHCSVFVVRVPESAPPGRQLFLAGDGPLGDWSATDPKPFLAQSALAARALLSRGSRPTT